MLLLYSGLLVAVLIGVYMYLVCWFYFGCGVWIGCLDMLLLCFRFAALCDDWSLWVASSSLASLILVLGLIVNLLTLQCCSL